MLPIIYTKESNNKAYYPPSKQPRGSREAPSNTPSVETTSETGPHSEKPTKEMTSETNSYASSDTSVTMMEDLIGHLSPGDIARCQKRVK